VTGVTGCAAETVVGAAGCATGASGAFATGAGVGVTATGAGVGATGAVGFDGVFVGVFVFVGVGATIGRTWMGGTGLCRGCVRLTGAARVGSRSRPRPNGDAVATREGVAAVGNGAASTAVVPGPPGVSPVRGKVCSRPSKRGNATAPATAAKSKIAAKNLSMP